MRRIFGALVVALLLAGCSTGGDTPPETSPSRAVPRSSPQAATSAPKLAVDAVGHSDNIRVVANVPLDAPFNGPQDWGTDLAFQGEYAFVGNYSGFTIVDISDPEKPSVVSRTVCDGGQNDISVTGNLLFLSVDYPMDGASCAAGAGEEGSASSWEGVRIFDVSDKKQPKYVTSIQTECGSHTHAVLPGEKTVYVYVASSGPVPGSETCPPPHAAMDIIEVPVDAPEKARVAAKPPVFGARPLEEGAEMTDPRGCHDVTVYPELKLAAGACFGDGVLMDISNPLVPKVLQVVQDPNFAVWHSATFNNDGTKLVFSDELGGGTSATCDRGSGMQEGANAIYDLTPERTLQRRGYFKIGREQTPEENCVAHNGSLIPVEGKDIMVQGWYQGGVSVWDFTDSANAKEIAYFERGPLRAGLELGGSWSAYYYNGFIYSSDITKGLDILEINDPLTDPAKSVKMPELNVQSQRRF
ncbi:LVIVD repeat-containing protein [Herbidospora sp. RD11066]